MPLSPQQTNAFEAKLDRFAELLSQGVEVPAICQRMGLSRNGGYSLLRKLRARMGEQAR